MKNASQYRLLGAQSVNAKPRRGTQRLAMKALNLRRVAAALVRTRRAEQGMLVNDNSVIDDVLDDA